MMEVAIYLLGVLAGVMITLAADIHLTRRKAKALMEQLQLQNDMLAVAQQKRPSVSSETILGQSHWPQLPKVQYVGTSDAPQLNPASITGYGPGNVTVS